MKNDNKSLENKFTLILNSLTRTPISKFVPLLCFFYSSNLFQKQNGATPGRFPSSISQFHNDIIFIRWPVIVWKPTYILIFSPAFYLVGFLQNQLSFTPIVILYHSYWFHFKYPFSSLQIYEIISFLTPQLLSFIGHENWQE